MNKYRDKSDFEINKAVAVAIGKVIGIRPDSNIIYLIGGDELIEFNPCSNPYDAMPIIMDNKIDLTHIVGNMVCAKHKEYWCIRKNPYRAGCEVYLLMKDAE